MRDRGEPVLVLLFCSRYFVAFFYVFCEHFNLALFFALQQRHVATCRHVVDDGVELVCCLQHLISS